MEGRNRNGKIGEGGRIVMERKKEGRGGTVEREGGGRERERKGNREREWKKEVEGGRERRNETEGEARRWRVGFWNVAGLTNKGVRFWKEIKKWEVVMMVESWVDGRGWDKVKRKLPKG